MQFSDYFKGKKVGVTGADGFIGSHLVERLVELGADVRAMVLYNSHNFWGNLELLPQSSLKEVDVFLGDVTDPFLVKKFVKDQEIVFHLASLIAIPYSYKAPQSYVQTNVMGTLNVMQACLEEGTRKVVHTSTSETYGTAIYTPINEEHPLQGQSPYSASKIGADKMAESYHLSFQLPVATLRPFNTFGPRQSARAVIPTIITQVLSGAETIKLGSLTPVRDFTFVKDTADAFLSVAHSPDTIGKVLNSGTGVGVTIGDVVDLISKITDKKIRIQGDDERVRPEKSEVMKLIADHSKLTKLTGWKPRYDFERGLQETIQYIGKNLDKYKIGQYTV
jgi:NAD dependent epimerase/dehydratase